MLNYFSKETFHVKYEIISANINKCGACEMVIRKTYDSLDLQENIEEEIIIEKEFVSCILGKLLTKFRDQYTDTQIQKNYKNPNFYSEI